ncbi:hypothetical protein QAD02_009468 [Eretmocerus hayati]|uniref:Uncharacterized protein n=1 Tax=Eretmocerus hayati TaxID=131215 RepID=A0ACC2N9G8_9HYME|nr:hypothetical protein QAD02_009468 [Eretmocerus hayati]
MHNLPRDHREALMQRIVVMEHIQQKFLKRTSDELESGGTGGAEGAAFGEPSVKLQCTQSSSAGVSHHAHANTVPNPNGTSTGPTPGSQPPPSAPPQGGSNNAGNTGSGGAPEGLTKFSVEIVQQLEFTTSAANSQAQQISTNVTVKALTNASVKSDLSQQSLQVGQQPPTSADIINSLVECKQEQPDSNDFDLEQCAAALEKDPCFPGFVVDFMEDDKEQVHAVLQQQASLNAQQQVYNSRMPYSAAGLDFKSEMNPASQTLKQMAEQHQVKSQQIGMGNPGQQQTGPYVKSNGVNFQPQQQSEMFNQAQQQQARQQQQQQGPQGAKGPGPNILGPGAYKQQYSPYGSPGSMPNHGSPGYQLPPRISQAQGPGPGPGPQPSFNNSTPPRPNSGSGGTSTQIQINQAQQLHINNPSHQIQCQ